MALQTWQHKTKIIPRLIMLKLSYTCMGIAKLIIIKIIIIFSAMILVDSQPEDMQRNR